MKPIESAIDKNGWAFKTGDRVEVLPETDFGSDASRYRTQHYGAGTVAELNNFGAYIEVDAGDGWKVSRTWTTCRWNDERETYQFSKIVKL